MCNHQNQDLEKIGPPEKMRIPGKTPGVSASGRLSLGLVGDGLDRLAEARLPGPPYWVSINAQQRPPSSSEVSQQALFPMTFRSLDVQRRPLFVC